MPLPKYIELINKIFPPTPERLKAAQKFMRWLKKNSRPVIIKPFRLKVVYSKENLEQVKALLSDYSVEKELIKASQELLKKKPPVFREPSFKP